MVMTRMQRDVAGYLVTRATPKDVPLCERVVDADKPSGKRRRKRATIMAVS